jgi:hypothetical protein
VSSELCAPAILIQARIIRVQVTLNVTARTESPILCLESNAVQIVAPMFIDGVRVPVSHVWIPPIFGKFFYFRKGGFTSSGPVDNFRAQEIPCLPRNPNFCCIKENPPLEHMLRLSIPVQIFTNLVIFSSLSTVHRRKLFLSRFQLQYHKHFSRHSQVLIVPFSWSS